MTVLVQQVRDTVKGSIVDNTGAKKIVTDELLDLLQLKKWTTITHHADLRSAARIALKGAIENPALNVLLSDVIRDLLGGIEWEVIITPTSRFGKSARSL